MLSFRNLRIGAKLSLLIIISSVGLIAFAVYAFYTLGVVRINGPIYQGLARNQELVADVLPPPSYVIESYLTTLQMLDAARENDTKSVNILLKKVTALHADYETRHTYWAKNLPSSANQEINQALLVDSYQPAESFFQIFNDQFVPAIQSGKIEKANSIFHDQMTPIYEAHRAAIDKVVTLQNAAIKKSESEAGDLLRRSTILLVFLAIMVAGFVIGLGVLISRSITVPVSHLTLVANAIAGGNFEVRAVSNTTDEVGTLATTFNSMTSQLQDVFRTLEQRVIDRTKDLATVAEVGTTTATILETDRLLQAVVDLTKERFELYHSHVYLLDETGENLVLAAGAGEPGRIMAAEKRSIPLSREQSLVARAARERKGVIINDVRKAPDFLPNPLLPNTRSELAVPMIVGDKLIGVFDVQSDEVDRFTDSDINIQNTLAAQVATSIQNVRSFEQAQRQAQFETLVNTIGQKIQRSTTVEDTLQVAIRELGAAMGASRVKVSLGANTRQNGGEGTNFNS